MDSNGIKELAAPTSRTISVIVSPSTVRLNGQLDESLSNSQSKVTTTTTTREPAGADVEMHAPIKRNGMLLFGMGTVAGNNRMSYPREFKLTAIKYYNENGRNKYRTCKEFQITKSMLNGWLQKIDKIQQSRPGSLKSGRSGRRPQFPNVEKKLYAIYRAQLRDGNKVGNRWLRETAKLIAQRTCHPNELNGMCQFSERWLCNFKKRYNINLSKDWSHPDVASNPTPPIIDNTPESIEQMCAGSTTEEVKALQLPPIANKMERVEEAEEEETDCDSAETMVRQECQVKRGRKVQFPQVEQLLNRILCEKRLDGQRVTNRWLQDEAKRLAIELCPQTFHDAYKSARCMFSEHWLHNFKKRYGISLKQSVKVENPVVPFQADQGGEHSSRFDESSNADLLYYPALMERIDDLPTMVPLQNFTKSLLSINVDDWYMHVKDVSMAAEHSHVTSSKPIVDP
ncbi:hypothetical protein D918_01735 [Trichuris suis]|nr:hypothetical protein D918_01735 [Trichuris suis]